MHDRTATIGFYSFLVLLTLLSVTTRFYKLGHWSFSGDELYTKVETQSLISKDYLDSQNIIDALPRAVPLGYAWNALFLTKRVSEETANRLGPAVAGTIAVPIIFWLASRLCGTGFGVLLSSLVLLSSWNLLFAQFARFYSTAFLFCSVSLMSFCLAIKEESWKWGLVAGIAAGFSALTHTISLLVFALEVSSLIILRLQAGIRLKSKWILWFAIPALILIGLEVALFFKFCGLGWNKGVTWRYTPVQLLMGLASDFGWPLTCLSGIGLFVIARNYRKDNAKSVFGISAVVAVVLALIASRLTVFRQDYIFPLSLSFYALAAVAVLDIGNGLKSKFKNETHIIACAALLFLQLPSLISYYQDGQKYDWREAARVMDRLNQSGEQVFATVPGNLEYYMTAEKKNVYPLISLPEVWEGGRLDGRQIWAVVNYGRRGLSNALRMWLDANGHRMAHIYKNRFDYYQFTIDIYKIDRSDLSDVPGRQLFSGE